MGDKNGIIKRIKLSMRNVLGLESGILFDFDSELGISNIKIVIIDFFNYNLILKLLDNSIVMNYNCRDAFGFNLFSLKFTYKRLVKSFLQLFDKLIHPNYFQPVFGQSSIKGIKHE